MIHQNHHPPTFSRIGDLQPQHLAPRVFQNPSNGGADFAVPINDHPKFPTPSPILPSAHPYSPSQYPFFQAFIDYLQQSWILLDGAQTSRVSSLLHHAALPQASMVGSTSHITGVSLLPGGTAPSARTPPPKGIAEVLTSFAMTPSPGALPSVVPGPPFMSIPSPNHVASLHSASLNSAPVIFNDFLRYCNSVDIPGPSFMPTSSLNQAPLKLGCDVRNMATNLRSSR